MIEGWYESYPKVKDWQQEVMKQVAEQQYVLGVWGLKRRLPHWMSNESDIADLKRQGVNLPIQNYASDFNVFIMIEMDRLIKERNLSDCCKLVNTVHDSLLFEVHPDYADDVAKAYYDAIYTINESCQGMFGEQYITMVGDMEVGYNWGKLYGAVFEDGTIKLKEEH